MRSSFATRVGRSTSPRRSGRPCRSCAHADVISSHSHTQCIGRSSHCRLGLFFRSGFLPRRPGCWNCHLGQLDPHHLAPGWVHLRPRHVSIRAPCAKLPHPCSCTHLTAQFDSPDSTVEADEEISLEGWTSCPAFVTRTNQVYQSAPFRAIADQEKEYLDSLVPLLDGRAVTMQNMYNVFDYMNVQYIHNATFREIVSQNGTSDYIMVSPE